MDAMKKVVLTEGSAGKAKLGAAAGRGERMIERYMAGKSSPSPDTGYRIAVACELSEEDALAVARECATWKGQRTA